MKFPETFTEIVGIGKTAIFSNIGNTDSFAQQFGRVIEAQALQIIKGSGAGHPIKEAQKIPR